MRGDGPDAVARDIEGEVDRALRRRQATGDRRQTGDRGQTIEGEEQERTAISLEPAAYEVLCELEQLALRSLAAAVAGLHRGLAEAEADGSGLSAQMMWGPRLAATDALELYARAHEAALLARAEIAGAGGRGQGTDDEQWSRQSTDAVH